MAADMPGVAELLIVGLILLGLVAAVAMAAGLIVLLAKSSRLRQEEYHRKELEILDEVRQGLERMDRRVAAIETLLARDRERKEIQQ